MALSVGPVQQSRAPLAFGLQMVALATLLLVFCQLSVNVLSLSALQAPGADYSCFWAGAKTALSDPTRIYDFEHNTVLQGWPLGPGRLRPYIYPPSALFFFAPFTLPTYWTSYGLWVLSTGVLFIWAAGRIGAPWWLLLPIPSVTLVAFCGQVTFLVGGLMLGGLALHKRPYLAGVLFGLAAAIKPQFMPLVPIALLADGRWRTIFVAGATGLAICSATIAVWGPQVWLDWLAALPRFSDLIFHDRALTEYAVTPFAALVAAGHAGAWAFLLAPAAAALVWFGFRRTQDLADRSLLLFGASMLVTPYAMTYELALLAPGLAAYLSRITARRWTSYVAIALGHVWLPWPMVQLVLPLALAFVPRGQTAETQPLRRGIDIAD